jgi:two-component system, NtrC family, response regulator AtoC
MEDGNKRILIIDDDEDMRSLLADLLLGEGFEPESVGNGSEAFRKMAHQSYDLVITDIRMTGFSGLDILPGLKKLQPRTSVIAITAFGSDEVRRKALLRGADVYLEKPIRLEELRGLVHRILGGMQTG